MRLYEKYRPRSLTEIVGQAPARSLRDLAREPYCSAHLLIGPPGVGKTASAFALAADLGCEDEFTGCWMLPCSELSVDMARDLFEHTMRLRFGSRSGFKVLILEELETLSPQCQAYLKVALDTRKYPPSTIVVATSNGVGKLQPALIQRFEIHNYTDGAVYRSAVCQRLAEIWKEESGLTELPYGWQSWGEDEAGERYSFRLALDRMQKSLRCV